MEIKIIESSITIVQGLKIRVFWYLMFYHICPLCFLLNSWSILGQFLVNDVKNSTGVLLNFNFYIFPKIVQKMVLFTSYFTLRIFPILIWRINWRVASLITLMYKADFVWRGRFSPFCLKGRRFGSSNQNAKWLTTFLFE